MQISRTALAFVLLAGCDQAGVVARGSDRATVTVAGRQVTLAAPKGFCVDPKSTTVNADGAFVLFSDCGLLGGTPPAGGPVGAVMTASVASGGLGEGDASSDVLEDLARFSETAEGRAMLGHSGQSDRVRVVATRSRNGVLYLLVEDRGRQPIAGIERQFWRAFLEVDGNLAALSVLGFQGAGIGPTTGLAYLQGFADSVQRVNGG